MTTNRAPAERTPRVLLAAALWVLASTSVLTIAGMFVGRTEALSALLGGGIVLVFFAFGAVVVGAASQLAPQTALMVALITYTLQVVLIAVIFTALTEADAFASDLSAGWLAGALIVGTFAWMAGQLITTLRTPIPPWEGPVAGEPTSEVEPSVPGPEGDA